MNLVCRKSKIREKTDLGAWGRRQAQPGDWGRLSGCFSQIREIREKTDFRGGKVERGWGVGQIALVNIHENCFIISGRGSHTNPRRLRQTDGHTSYLKLIL